MNCSRRELLLSGATVVGSACWTLAGLSSQAIAQSSGFKPVNTSRRLSNPGRSHSFRRVADPTGRFKEKIDRFELRGGECSNRGDCTPRVNRIGKMKARTRSEKILTTRLGAGVEGAVQYSVLLPSEYTFIPSVGTTIGQILNAEGQGNSYDSYPMFSLDIDHGKSAGRVYAAMSEARDAELGKIKYNEITLGRLGRNVWENNRWIDVQVLFGLSTSSDGYLSVSINGKRVGTFTGRTMTRGGWLEVRVGLYQNGTNWFPGGPAKMPTQVAYFGNTGVFRKI